LSLPWKNLISILMDSCRVMRGEKAGLEALIRSRRAPHLLDVDGDTCHHAHNAAKAFSAPFGRHVERLLADLHTDFKWSSHSCKLLGDICVAFEVAYSPPQAYVPHRWLSLLNVSMELQRMFSVMTVFYFSFLSDSEKEIQQDVLDKILSPLPAKTKAAVLETQTSIKKLFFAGTKDGKERKQRIAGKLFQERDLTMAILNLYCKVLPILNQYILFFQKREPLMHKLHEQQELIIKEFLGCFVKPSLLLDAGPAQLVKLKTRLRSSEVLLGEADMFLGSAGDKLFGGGGKKQKSANHDLKKEFLQKTLKA
jgi:hypothetical protein